MSASKGQMKVLIQEVYAEPLEVKSIPIPEVVTGSALIKVISSGVVSYAREVYNGSRQYPYNAPMVPGTSCIGRVEAVGPDATSLKPGQLVYVDATIHSRDNPDDITLQGLVAGPTPGAQKLFDTWRNGTFADYTLVPLEVVFPIDEAHLQSMDISHDDLALIVNYLVPYGGLRDINLQAGETIIVTPATGGFGSAAVALCIAMGANVIAMGRNAASLSTLEKAFPRVKTVPITSNVEDDVAALTAAAGGRKIDAVFEISPTAAAKSTHIKSSILALGRHGRVSLMGGILEDVAFPMGAIMGKSLLLKGTWMYTREQVQALLAMIHTGILKIGQGAGTKITTYEFKEWKEAFDKAADEAGWGKAVVLKP